MSNIIPYQDIERMAAAVAKSNLFGVKSPDQAVALMLIAQAEGMHPAIAARDYHVVQNRPVLKADAMLARFQQAGGSVSWKTYTDAEVTGVFSHPQGGSLELTWTFAQATKIGLTGKDNWRNYPRAMLRARVISEGIRTVYPGCVVGVYTPEEAEDFKDDKPPKIKNMGKADVVEIPAEDPPGEIFPLYMPGENGPEIFSTHNTKEEWVDAYGSFVARIQNSSKVAEEDKPGKIELLGQANIEVYKTLDSMQRVKINAAIVKAGGNVDPKRPSLPKVTETLSEE